MSIQKRFLFFALVVLGGSFFGCATTARVTKFDIGYFEQFRQPEHRLVYITSETSGLVPRGDIYVLTNPDDIALLNKAPGVYMGGNLSPVYIPNHKTDGGKGLAVFSLPKEENDIYIWFNGVRNDLGSLTTINHRGVCTIAENVDDVFISVTLGKVDNGEMIITYFQWYDQEIIQDSYSSCTGKYGYYADKNKKEQIGFIKVR